ncbi:UNVERIFIED_CONTAM: hypothetical protein RMT77_017662 [Armadillidium vulgare]
MQKVAIFFILAGVLSSNLANAGSISKAKCEEKGGKYCPGLKVKECYINLKEEVSSYEEAVDACEERGAVVPYMNMTDYSNYLKCCGYPWSFPLTVFLRNPLPTEDKCLAFTAQSKAEFFTLSSCSIKGKANVVCEIHL